MKGKPRHQLLMYPDDMAARRIQDGQVVVVRSRTGEVVIDVMGSTDLMPGVVSIPHGFGHHLEGVRQSVANAFPGISANDLTDESAVDAVSANAILNGVPVTVSVT
jgi:anaerobic selenocysteine-containing dehydrogenase